MTFEPVEQLVVYARRPFIVFTARDELVREICQKGIDGIEAFYPRHDAADTERYMAMAARYGLRCTGGSDFHGFPTRYPDKVGIFTVEDQYAEPFYREHQTLD